MRKIEILFDNGMRMKAQIKERHLKKIMQTKRVRASIWIRIKKWIKK